MTTQTVTRVIPSKGTRAKGAVALAVFSVSAWLLSALVIKIGWFTVDDAKIILWTTEHMKWGLTASFSVYVASETGVKLGEAYMNRNDT